MVEHRALTLIFYLTDNEKDVLEGILKEGSITRAAERLNVSTATASMRLRRLRDRYNKAKEFIEAVDFYKRKMPGRYL